MDFVKQTAAQLDFEVFDRGNGVFEFEGKNAATKNAVVNWGLAAVVWLVARQDRQRHHPQVVRPAPRTRERSGPTRHGRARDVTRLAT